MTDHLDDVRETAIAAVTGAVAGIGDTRAAVDGICEVFAVDIARGDIDGVAQLVGQLVSIAAQAVEGWAITSGHQPSTLLEVLRFS